MGNLTVINRKKQSLQNSMVFSSFSFAVPRIPCMTEVDCSSVFCDENLEEGLTCKTVTGILCS